MTVDMWKGFMFYGFLAIFTGFFATFSVKKLPKLVKFFFAVLTIFLPSIFAGLRYGIGTDFFSYRESFYRITIFNENINTEYLYLLINKVIGYLNLDFNCVLFICSFVTTLFIYLTLRDYKSVLNVGLGIFIYMLLYYQVSFNAIRQIMALSVLLFSVRYIFRRKFFHFLVMVIIAMGFHKTAFIYIPLYFLYWLYGSNKYRVLKLLSYTSLVIIMMNFSSILYPILSKYDAFSYYAESYLKSNIDFNLGIGIFFRTLPFVIPCLLLWRYFKKDNRFILLFNIFIIGSISLLTAYGAENFTERISYYFLSTLIIIIPYIYRISFQIKKHYLGIIVLLSIIMLWWWDFIYLGRHETIPYTWIFSN